MKTLDKSKDFGTIFGDTEGRVYEQDGEYFTGDGRLWGEPAVKPSKPRAIHATPLATAPDDQLSQQLKG